MNAPSSKPICDTDPSRRGGIDLNAEALGDLYEALKGLVVAIDLAFPPREFAPPEGEGINLRRARAALRKAEQVKS